MRIAVFTSSSPRHVNFVRLLAALGDEVIAVVEGSTHRLGVVSEGYATSDGLATYFDRARAAERDIFGERAPMPKGVTVLPTRMGELSHFLPKELEAVLSADRYVVFGSSWIRGWLAEELIARGALNLHMGMSPFYRGSACNFWALWDECPELVGATIHYLARGLDDGDIVRHVVPVPDVNDPFAFTMSAVRAGQHAIIDLLASNAPLPPGIPQDPALLRRYSRSRDFTTDIATQFMARRWNVREVEARCRDRADADFVNLQVR